MKDDADDADHKDDDADHEDYDDGGGDDADDYDGDDDVLYHLSFHIAISLISCHRQGRPLRRCYGHLQPYHEG